MNQEVKLKEAIKTVLEAFDKGLFVRSTKEDAEPGWAMRFARPISALAVLREFAEKPVSRPPVEEDETMRLLKFQLKKSMRQTDEALELAASNRKIAETLLSRLNQKGKTISPLTWLL